MTDQTPFYENEYSVWVTPADVTSAIDEDIQPTSWLGVSNSSPVEVILKETWTLVPEPTWKPVLGDIVTCEKYWPGVLGLVNWVSKYDETLTFLDRDLKTISADWSATELAPEGTTFDEGSELLNEVHKFREIADRVLGPPTEYLTMPKTTTVAPEGGLSDSGTVIMTLENAQYIDTAGIFYCNTCATNGQYTPRDDCLIHGPTGTQ